MQRSLPAGGSELQPTLVRAMSTACGTHNSLVLLGGRVGEMTCGHVLVFPPPPGGKPASNLIRLGFAGERSRVEILVILIMSDLSLQHF